MRYFTFIITMINLGLFFCSFKEQTIKWTRDSTPANAFYIGPDSTQALIDGEIPFTIKPLLENKDIYGAISASLDPGELNGKTIRVGCYIKSMELKGPAGFWLTTMYEGPVATNHKSIKKSSGWKKYQVDMKVPEDITEISFGVFLNGPGQIWLSGITIETIK